MAQFFSVLSLLKYCVVWFYVSSNRSGTVCLGVTVAEGVGNGFSTQQKRLWPLIGISLPWMLYRWPLKKNDSLRECQMTRSMNNPFQMHTTEEQRSTTTSVSPKNNFNINILVRDDMAYPESKLGDWE